MSEKTLCIIKPRAVKKGLTGKIIDNIIENKFKILAIKKTLIQKSTAEKFYAIHKDKFFYNDLIEFMTSGPCVIIVLEKVNAVENFRKIIGDTDSAKAKENTIRNKFGLNNRANAVHGSDSEKNFKKEFAFFFTNDDIIEV
ncbi:MAG: nucleoside-diphosphate kinase [Candidatus Marinimicrobia bacterium]|nr:nucleoside-diphosphate kinase [Candidatus Neomarinimicrobiota bacterium]